MSFALYLGAFIAVSLIVTYLIKKRTKQQTFYILSLIRTKKGLKTIERLSKLGPIIDYIAELGLILGFGALAVDYLYLRKQPKNQRYISFIASAALLALAFYGIDFLLGGFISASPNMKEFMPIIALIFAVTGFGGLMITMLFAQAADIIVKMLAGKKPCPGVAPLIPGVEIPNVPIVVPLHAWLSLFIILIIHEGMHGIAARRNGFKLKSTGLLLLGFLPIGAFVEPDEKQVVKANPRKALRLFAAGPTANMLALFAVQFIIIGSALALSATIEPWAQQVHLDSVDGVYISEVTPSTEFCGSSYANPAFGAFEPGSKLLSVNSTEINTTGDALKEVAINRYKETSFSLLAPGGEETVKSLEPNAMGVFGFVMEEKAREGFVFPQGYEFYQEAKSLFFGFLYWLFLLNLLVGLINFLPLAAFDGGRIAMILLQPYFGFMHMPKKDLEKFIGRTLMFPIVALLIINAVPLFL